MQINEFRLSGRQTKILVKFESLELVACNCEFVILQIIFSLSTSRIAISMHIPKTKIHLESIHYNLSHILVARFCIWHIWNNPRSGSRTTRDFTKFHYISLLLYVTRSEVFLKSVECKTWPPICGLIFELSYYEQTISS